MIKSRMIGFAGALAVLAGAVAGCGGGDATFHSAAPSAPTARPAPAGPLTLAFAGDVHFTGRTAGLLSDPASAFGPIASVLQDSDLTMLNLETAITERGTPEPKQYRFRAPITAFAALKAAGVDVVTLANNHVLDYGQVGLADTLVNVRRADFPYVGIGRNAEEAYAPLYLTVKDVKIAFLAFNQVHELESTWVARDNRAGVAMTLDLDRSVAAVRTARSNADLVVVFNHWGQEGKSCPTGEQKSFAAKIAGAGADLIIGSHAHTLQGDGWMGGTYVAYGLANFLWYGESFSTETGVLKLTVEGRKVVKNEFLPAVVSATGQPIPLKGDAAAKVSKRFAGLRQCAGLAAAPS
ncbi:CapA family protein [Planosporangium flavigriseum]|uniref:CapA family protein n=1 Tax=Planosporangium flavigriseum TaxID=373681 RepID=UPI001EF30E8B|nr:CapA family protein [Planosporangium flavigriseum]